MLLFRILLLPFVKAMSPYRLPLEGRYNTPPRVYQTIPVMIRLNVKQNPFKWEPKLDAHGAPLPMDTLPNATSASGPHHTGTARVVDDLLVTPPRSPGNPRRPTPQLSVEPALHLHDTPPRVKKGDAEEIEVNSFSLPDTASCKSEPEKYIPMAQHSGGEDSGVPSTPAKCCPERYLPTPDSSPATLPTPNISASPRSSRASSPASALIPNPEPMATAALSTHPPSDRKKSPPKANARRNMVHEDQGDEDDSGAECYSTPTKTPSSGRRGASPNRISVLWARVKQEERLPAPDFTGFTTVPTHESSPVYEDDEDDDDDDSGSEYHTVPMKSPSIGRLSVSSNGNSLSWDNVKQEGRSPAPSSTTLPTPEPSPVKQNEGSLKPKPSTKPVSGNYVRNLFPDPPPSSEATPEPKGLFHDIELQECTIFSMPREMLYLNGDTFLSYQCKDGEPLTWFQARDLEQLVDETVSREIMKVECDANWKMVPQGKILRYEDGLGDILVACLLVVETLQQIKAVYEDRGLVFKKKPVLVIAQNALQTEWMEHLETLSGDSLTVQVYDKGGKAMPTADVVICNIIILRNQYDRWLKHWERREEAYEKNPVGPKPSRTNPTARDLFALAKTAPFFISTFRYLIIDELYDESHSCISNAHTLSSRSLLKAKADHVLILSGTLAQSRSKRVDIAMALLLHRSRRKSFRTKEAGSRKLSPKKDMRDYDVVDSVEMTETLIEQTMITRLNHSDQEDEDPFS